MPKEPTSFSSSPATDRASPAVQRSIPETVLAKLLHHAAFAAHLVGHLDDDAHAELIRQLGEHVDTVVHGLTELLGDPRTLAAPDAAAPEAHDGAPMLASSAGGAS